MRGRYARFDVVAPPCNASLAASCQGSFPDLTWLWGLCPSLLWL